MTKSSPIPLVVLLVLALLVFVPVSVAALETLCDGLDDDHDGLIDEDFFYQGMRVGELCNGIGECGDGAVECVDIYTADCDTNPGRTYDESTAETCNGLDDDCDALIDEDFTYQGLNINQSCDGIGKCGAGLVECSGTSAADCSTNPGASADESVAEICDGNDSDCNGVIDDGGDALCLLPESGLWCEGHDGECMGPDGCYFQPFDCTDNDISPITRCDNIPDENPFTWDWFPGFTSSCDDVLDICTTGTITLTHACDITQCGAECEDDTVCTAEEYCYIDECSCELIGDVNRNGVINMLDLTLAGAAYGSEPGDVQWNPDADVQPKGGDGDVDIFDIEEIGNRISFA